jgi:hypothetical protein
MWHSEGNPLTRNREPIPDGLISLGRLLFWTSVLVNAAGGLVAAVASAGVANLPASELVARYITLPLTAQAALIVALLAAFIVPIGASVAGEGLATLVFERKHTDADLGVTWEQVKPQVERQALYDHLLSFGVQTRRAGELADGYLKYSRGGSSGPSKPTSDHSDSPDGSDATSAVRRPKVKGAFDLAVRYLADHSDELSDMTSDILADKVGIGRSTAGDALKAYRAQVNGRKEMV